MVRTQLFLALAWAATARGATVCTAVPGACDGTFAGLRIELLVLRLCPTRCRRACAAGKPGVVGLGQTSISGTVPAELAQIARLSAISTLTTTISGRCRPTAPAHAAGAALPPTRPR